MSQIIMPLPHTSSGCDN